MSSVQGKQLPSKMAERVPSTMIWSLAASVPAVVLSQALADELAPEVCPTLFCSLALLQPHSSVQAKPHKPAGALRFCRL
jgi:hypothetical protein